MRLARIMAVTLAALGGLAFLVLLKAPSLVEHRVERALSAPGLQSAVEHVEIVWPEGVVTLRGVRVVDVQTQRTVLEAPEIQMDVALGTLLPGRRFRFERAEADSPFVDLNNDHLRGAPWLQGRFDGERALEIEYLQVKNGTLRLPDEALGRKAEFSPVDVRLENVGGHAGKERFPTTLSLTATLQPDGLVRAELKTDLKQPQPTFDVELRRESLPIEVLGKRLGLKATSGTASFGFHALLENGAYDGRVGLHVENVGVEDRGPMGELKEQATELGLDVASETGLLTRERRFAGQLPDPNPSLSTAVKTVLENGFEKLGE